MKSNHQCRCALYLLVIYLTTSLYAAQDRYEPILIKIKSGETAAAESELRSIIESSPTDALAHFYLGTIHAMRRDYLAAVGEYREAVRLQPKDARFHLALGYTYKDIAQYEDAIKALRAAIDLDPKNAEAYFVLGAIYHLQEKDESAKKEFEKGLELDPKNIEGRLMYADANLITSGFSKAREMYAQVLLEDATNTHAHLGLASIFAMNPDTYSEAVEHLEQVKALEPKNFEAPYQLGQLYIKMNRNNEAIDQLRAALDLNPKLASAHLILGRLLVKVGTRQEGEQHLAIFTELTQQEAEEKKAGRHAEDLLGRGRELAWQNRLREAIAKFNESLEINPDSSSAHAMLGKIYLSMKDVTRAGEHIRRALELDSYNSEYHYLLGLILKEERKYLQAIAAFERVTAAKPDFADPYNMLGNLYSDLGRYAEAVPYYLKVIELEPEQPEPHLNLATAYKNLGRNEESEKELAIYKKLSGIR